MRILSISCIHGDMENLMMFIDKAVVLEPDIVVCTGDFTDYFLPKGFGRIDIGETIVEELKAFKKPLIVVPGSWDKDLIEFFDKKNISVHGKGKVVDDVGFYGYGGAQTPFNTPFEPSEEEIENGLEKAYHDVIEAEIKIQVTHAPPKGTAVDIITTGAHVGSNTVRKFIDKVQPNAAFCSHIHEGRGVDEIGNTKIINSGRFPEGYCGLAEIDKGSVSAKIVSLI